MQHFESLMPNQAQATSTATQAPLTRAAFLIVLQPLCAVKESIGANRAQVVRAASLAPILRERLPWTLVDPVQSIVRYRHAQYWVCPMNVL